jgi:hypothetical protein
LSVAESAIAMETNMDINTFFFFKTYLSYVGIFSLTLILHSIMSRISAIL